MTKAKLVLSLTSGLFLAILLVFSSFFIIHSQIVSAIEIESERSAYSCQNHDPDWLFCEDWENLSSNVINQNEKDCVAPNFWGEGGRQCYAPPGWNEWYSLANNSLGDYEGISSEYSFSGDYSLRISNDPACDCPSGNNPLPGVCGDAWAPCDQPKGGDSGYVKATFDSAPRVYARTYIKWGSDYDINHGPLSTGKGFYLWDNASSGTRNFHFECRSSLPGAPTWGGEFTEPEGEKSLAVLTWYDRDEDTPNLCWGGDCFVLPDEPALCEEFLDGKWHAIEIMGDIQINTLALWIDGRKRAEEIVPPSFYESTATGFHEIWLGNHYHGGVSHLQSLYWDDIATSTSYIGLEECVDGEEIKGACYIGQKPGENNTNADNIYLEGYACNGQWQSDECSAGPVLEASITNPNGDDIVHPGETLVNLVTINNNSDQARNLRARVHLVKCDGNTIYNFRKDNNIQISAGGFYQKTINFYVPRNITAQWKNCDLTYQMIVEDRMTNEVVAEDAYVWRIED